jgi:hypothetical protein
MIGYPYHSGEQIKFAQTQKNEFVILISMIKPNDFDNSFGF